MIIIGKTDKGKVREANEDSCRIFKSKDNLIDYLVVADGMGGHKSGEIASRIAVDFIVESLPCLELSREELDDAIINVLNKANEQILLTASEDSKYEGMGTTIIIAAIIESHAHIVHVGDSRAYLVNGNDITQLTVDHSYTQELIKMGCITKEEAKVHPQKNIVTQALGSIEGLRPEINHQEIKKNNQLLLCSDGLTNMLSDDEILATIKTAAHVEKACDMLIDRANENGGIDNITVILAENE